jgi:hypothetical protein
MRNTMRPVTLSRIVETASFGINNSRFSVHQLTHYLKTSMERAHEVTEEMVRMDFLKKEDDLYSLTERGILLIGCIKTSNWNGIHSLFMKYSFYCTFFDAVQSFEPATPPEILQELKSAGLPFNETSRHVLCDWCERIGSLQRNVFTNQYYSIRETDKEFPGTFLEIYHSLNTKTGLNLRLRYIEIPKIREYVCQSLNMRRESFDVTFIALYKKNIGRLELAGAPVTTRAKNSIRKVKNVSLFQVPDRITMILSSDQYLSGLTVGNKSYYYVAYHGGDLID